MGRLSSPFHSEEKKGAGVGHCQDYSIRTKTCPVFQTDPFSVRLHQRPALGARAGARPPPPVLVSGSLASLDPCSDLHGFFLKNRRLILKTFDQRRSKDFTPREALKTIGHPAVLNVQDPSSADTCGSQSESVDLLPVEGPLQMFHGGVSPAFRDDGRGQTCFKSRAAVGVGRHERPDEDKGRDQELRVCEWRERMSAQRNTSFPQRMAGAPCLGDLKREFRVSHKG